MYFRKTSRHGLRSSLDGGCILRSCARFHNGTDRASRGRLLAREATIQHGDDAHLSTAGYSQTPFWKKLGLREGSSLLLLDAPAGWSVPDLPAGLTCERAAIAEGQERAPSVVLAFFAALAPLRDSLPRWHG